MAPCPGRFSPSPHLTSFNGSMNGQFSVELNLSPAHCVLEVSGGKHQKAKMPVYFSQHSGNPYAARIKQVDSIF